MVEKQKSLILLTGQKYTSHLWGNIRFDSSRVSISGRYRGIMKKERNFYDIPIELVSKETEMLLDNKPTGIKIYFIRQSVFGDRDYSNINPQFTEEYNSLKTQNQVLLRELNSMRRKVIDIDDKDKFQEAMFKDMKYAGKVRAISYWGSEQQDQRSLLYDRPFGRNIITQPPIEY